jgi:hypothetical protein
MYITKRNIIKPAAYQFYFGGGGWLYLKQSVIKNFITLTYSQAGLT